MRLVGGGLDRDLERFERDDEPCGGKQLGGAGQEPAVVGGRAARDARLVVVDRDEIVVGRGLDDRDDSPGPTTRASSRTTANGSSQY
jgi:hypothetical protein